MPTDLDDNAFLIAHISILFHTYQALDEETRDKLLRVLGKTIRDDKAAFFREHLARAPRTAPSYQATVPATLADIERAFFRHISQLLSDLARPHDFSPRPPKGI